MRIPAQITFRHMSRSETLLSKIEERVNHLERFCDTIISCRVVVELTNHKHNQGNLFQVRVDVKLPGKELVTSRNPGQNHAHEDPYVAVRDSFDALERQLDHYLRSHRNHSHAKLKEPSKYATVSKIIRGDGEYGFLSTVDGREIYFHRNSVLNNHFDSLEIGTEVRFDEESGNEGPQASTVDLVGKWSHRNIA